MISYIIYRIVRFAWRFDVFTETVERVLDERLNLKEFRHGNV